MILFITQVLQLNLLNFFLFQPGIQFAYSSNAFHQSRDVIGRSNESPNVRYYCIDFTGRKIVDLNGNEQHYCFAPPGEVWIDNAVSCEECKLTLDGHLVSKNIFPDFGLSGNDLAYHFIPAKEIWIDGQVCCEEMEYSIIAELMERKLMQQGSSYSDAYEVAAGNILMLRGRMDARIRNHPVLIMPDTLQRESGLVDPDEK